MYKFFPANSDGDRLLIYAPDGKRVLETFHLRPPERRALLVPGRLRGAALVGTHRLRLHVGDHGRTGRARAGRGMEEAGRVSALAYPAGARAGGRRGLRRTAPSQDPRRCGESAIRQGSTHKGPLPGPLSWQALFLRLSGLPAAGRSGAAVPPARTRATDIGVAADRGLHDGARRARSRRSCSIIPRPSTSPCRPPTSKASSRSFSRILRRLVAAISRYGQSSAEALEPAVQSES